MQTVPEGLRPSEVVVRCTHCSAALVLPKRRSSSPPFCSKQECRQAYQRWRYHNAPGVKERTVEGVLRRRREGRPRW